MIQALSVIVNDVLSQLPQCSVSLAFFLFINSSSETGVLTLQSNVSMSLSL